MLNKIKEKMKDLLDGDDEDNENKNEVDIMSEEDNAPDTAVDLSGLNTIEVEVDLVPLKARAWDIVIEKEALVKKLEELNKEMDEIKEKL